MTFDILDETTLARLGNIDVWVSVYWDEPYNTEGSFSLEVRPTPENLALLREVINSCVRCRFLSVG